MSCPQGIVLATKKIEAILEFGTPEERKELFNLFNYPTTDV
jgi:hypothetical protein